MPKRFTPSFLCPSKQSAIDGDGVFQENEFHPIMQESGRVVTHPSLSFFFFVVVGGGGFFILFTTLNSNPKLQPWIELLKYSPRGVF